MRGTFVSRHLDIWGECWIDRWGNYLMVGLSADVPEDQPSRISGRVGSGPVLAENFIRPGERGRMFVAAGWWDY
jgi:hypothetical protein